VVVPGHRVLRSPGPHQHPQRHLLLAAPLVVLLVAAPLVLGVADHPVAAVAQVGARDAALQVGLHHAISPTLRDVHVDLAGSVGVSRGAVGLDRIR